MTPDDAAIKLKHLERIIERLLYAVTTIELRVEELEKDKKVKV
jgi:hypothetical protein